MPEIDRFESLTAKIASDPSVAGQWIVLLPVIAQQCERIVDHDSTALLVNGFDSPDAVDEAADYFASGASSDLKAHWDAIAKSDRDQACRLADGLWGRTGTLAPGILRDPAGVRGAEASQPATGAESR